VGTEVIDGSGGGPNRFESQIKASGRKPRGELWASKGVRARNPGGGRTDKSVFFSWGVLGAINKEGGEICSGTSYLEPKVCVPVHPLGWVRSTICVGVQCVSEGSAREGKTISDQGGEKKARHPTRRKKLCGEKRQE